VGVSGTCGVLPELQGRTGALASGSGLGKLLPSMTSTLLALALHSRQRHPGRVGLPGIGPLASPGGGTCRLPRSPLTALLGRALGTNCWAASGVAGRAGAGATGPAGGRPPGPGGFSGHARAQRCSGPAPWPSNCSFRLDASAAFLLCPSALVGRELNDDAEPFWIGRLAASWPGLRLLLPGYGVPGGSKNFQGRPRLLRTPGKGRRQAPGGPGGAGGLTWPSCLA